MGVAQWLEQGKQAISVLSNPGQSSVLAGGAAGAFSAQVNNLRKQASVDLERFGVKIPKPIKGATESVLGPVKSLLKGSSSNPIPEGSSGTILGMSFLSAALLGVGAFVVAVVFLARAVR